MAGPRDGRSTEGQPGIDSTGIRAPAEAAATATDRKPFRPRTPQADATVHRWRPTLPFAQSGRITPGVVVLALFASLARPALAADGPGAEATPIRLDAGTARHRKALAGTAAEGIAEGEFVVAKVDFDGDGTDETVVPGRARLWCSAAGCSTMVLKKAGARPVVLLDANLPRKLGMTTAPVGRYRALVGLDGNGRIAIGDRGDGRMYGRPLVFPMRTER